MALDTILNKITWLSTSLTAALLLMSSGQAFAQNQNHTFEQLDSLLIVEDRPVVVLFHAEWCKFCHQMKQTTLLDKEVVESIETNFYLISFDVETRENISYSGVDFSFIPSGNDTGVHELALELTSFNGPLELPALCVFNSQNEVLFNHNGYLNSDEFLEILRALTPRR